ncbi:MAG: hypothetical protein ACXAC7_08160 [Candidatus Hodarchaeales archaeon]
MKIYLRILLLNSILIGACTSVVPGNSANSTTQVDKTPRTFNLSNETLSIFSSHIADAAYNFSAFIYCNTTDEGLGVIFNGIETIIWENQSYSIDNEVSAHISLSLNSTGNTTGYYWYTPTICCGATGFLFDIWFIIAFICLIPILNVRSFLRRIRK